jgi:flagellar basal-body rod modification protein FlgD
MEVNKVDNSGTAVGVDAKLRTSAADLDYNAFLKLLVAQMKNQDPLEPMKSSDYVAQLATFSQVEKSVQMNDRINELLSVGRMQQAEGIIGLVATSADGTKQGVVMGAKVVDGKVVASLSSGQELTIDSTVTISGS